MHQKSRDDADREPMMSFSANGKQDKNDKKARGKKKKFGETQFFFFLSSLHDNNATQMAITNRLFTMLLITLLWLFSMIRSCSLRREETVGLKVVMF
jgi:hypothetical protein